MRTLSLLRIATDDLRVHFRAVLPLLVFSIDQHHQHHHHHLPYIGSCPYPAHSGLLSTPHCTISTIRLNQSNGPNKTGDKALRPLAAACGLWLAREESRQRNASLRIRQWAAFFSTSRHIHTRSRWHQTRLEFESVRAHSSRPCLPRLLPCGLDAEKQENRAALFPGYTPATDEELINDGEAVQLVRSERRGAQGSRCVSVLHTLQ